MERETLSYSVLTESELNEIIAGKQIGYAIPWPGTNAPPLSDGMTGVLWRRVGDGFDNRIQPLALIVREDQIRRLIGRFAQLRSDLSPLSAWCHLLTPDRFYSLRSTTIEPVLDGLEAAWSGLIIAEAALLAEKSLLTLRLPACLATHAFGFARAQSLWGRVSITEIGMRLDSASRLLKADGIPQRNTFRLAKVRSALDPIYHSVLSLSGSNLGIDSALAPIVQALRGLQQARARKDPDETRHLVAPLKGVIPEADDFSDFQLLTPEHRLRLFDKLVNAINAIGDREKFRRNCLAMLAGYLSTVAAGGKPALKLAENHSTRWPEIMAWAYTIGGIGEGVFWTSGFDGLGRLVARELIRPFRLDEPPSCDLALEEVSVLVDTKLSDPLVYLRIKQARIATVAIYPGVNISVLISETLGEPLKELKKDDRQLPQPSIIGDRNASSLIADAIWPYIQTRVENQIRSLQTGSQGGRKRKSGSQSPLPLKDIKE
ncbi:MAG TPA: hypothetical protein VGK22_09445 [Candidatus Angelobacter sp.]|jgi:hypothetical protein